MTILQNARIDGLNVETLAFHVEGLEQAVGNIEEGLNPRGKCLARIPQNKNAA